jgi:hypothetical protein
MELSATLPASDLARLQRRVAFLEAAVIQMLRDDRGLREWFSAAEIANLGLPGLPMTRAGIARIAREQGWAFRTTRGKGGHQRLYHFADLPRRAFTAFIERVVRAGPDPGRDDEAGDGSAPVPARSAQLPALARPLAPVKPRADNATPPWILPLLRLLRTGAGPLEHALAELPHHLAPGIPCPSADDARAVLAQIGVAGD